MKEVLLTSSVLILALLILREVFREKISRRVQYALWGLVLLRLLIPVNLPAVDFSVLSAVEPARVQMEQRLEENPVYVLPVERQEMPLSSDMPVEPAVILPIEGRHVAITSEKGQPAVMTSYALSLEEALGLGWIVGMCGMGVWMAASNLGFWVMLRKKRIPLELDCKHPVFLVEDGLVSPCLFGVFRPAVYLTPGTMENEDSLRHVLVHEETHGRHGDPVWAALRCVCLVVYWFDPLVWWAAAASREDCELACDEGALKRLGEDQRIPYGQTLLRLIPLQKKRRGALLTATTMTSDKKRMKERIVRIAENKKMKTAALCAMLAVVVAVCAVTFTGCKAEEEHTPDVPDTAVKTDAPVENDAPAADVPEDGPAELVIPLAAVSYGPARMETQSVDALFSESRHDEHDGRHGQERVGGGCHTTEGCGTFAWSYDGNIYVSSHDLRLSSFPSDYFLCIEDENYGEDEFRNVFGYDGVVISYFGQASDGYWTTVSDFYTFDEDGASLLARVYGAYYLNDLDGDGVEELIGISNWDCQLFYEKDGQICEANVKEQVCENWPELEWRSTRYDILPQQHCLGLQGPVYRDVLTDGTPGGRTLVTSKQIAFDGENLVVRAPERSMTDHMLDGIQELSAVTDAAKAMAKAAYEDCTAHYGEGWSDAGRKPPEWDDYCVVGLENVYMNDSGQLPGGIQLAAYDVDFEIHSPTPDDVVLAGGVYVYDNGWAGNILRDEPYLVFQIMEDGSYKQLENHIPFDVGAPSEYFDGAIAVTMMYNQLAKPSEFSGETLFYGMECSPLWFMDVLALWPEREQDAALAGLLDYAGGARPYEKEHLEMAVSAGYEYSEDGAKVAERLKNLMES